MRACVQAVAGGRSRRHDRARPRLRSAYPFVCAPNDSGRISMRPTLVDLVGIDAVASHLYLKASPMPVLEQEERRLPLRGDRDAGDAASLTGPSGDGLPHPRRGVCVAGAAPLPTKPRAALAETARKLPGEPPAWLQVADLVPNCVGLLRHARLSRSAGAPGKSGKLIALACNARLRVAADGIRRHTARRCRTAPAARSRGDPLASGTAPLSPSAP